MKVESTLFPRVGVDRCEGSSSWKIAVPCAGQGRDKGPPLTGSAAKWRMSVRLHTVRRIRQAPSSPESRRLGGYRFVGSCSHGREPSADGSAVAGVCVVRTELRPVGPRQDSGRAGLLAVKAVTPMLTVRWCSTSLAWPHARRSTPRPQRARREVVVWAVKRNPRRRRPVQSGNGVAAFKQLR